ncbi:MAG: hypothetical protein IT427_13490 [Pirellulales bacterium]|nr:hypothetical protein [Pirellulales bacterium]
MKNSLKFASRERKRPEVADGLYSGRLRFRLAELDVPKFDIYFWILTDAFWVMLDQSKGRAEISADGADL